MANVDNRFGLRPVGHISGAPWNGATMKCYCDTDESNALFIGDAVILAGSGDALARCPTITKAVAGATNPILGVITSFEPVMPAFGATANLNLQIIYRPASTAMYANVCVDPTVLYEIQGDSAGVIAKTDIGTNFNLVFTHAGDTATGLSGMELNSASKANTSSYQLKLWGAADIPTNDVSLINAIWVVLINLNQLFSAGVDTIGAAIAGGVGV